MRKVEIAGKEYVINPLTYGAMKRLRASGNDPLAVNTPVLLDVDGTLTAILAEAGLTEGLDDLPFPDVMQLGLAVLHETVGREEEVKN